MTPKTKLTQHKSGAFRTKNSRGNNQVKAEADESSSDYRR
jgi:hypothetical protein